MYNSELVVCPFRVFCVLRLYIMQKVVRSSAELGIPEEGADSDDGVDSRRAAGKLGREFMMTL